MSSIWIKLAALLALFSTVQCSPLIRRQKSNLKPTDIELLNYLLVLEHLQYALYQEGLANYTKENSKSANYQSSIYSDFSVSCCRIPTRHRRSSTRGPQRTRALAPHGHEAIALHVSTH